MLETSRSSSYLGKITRRKFKSKFRRIIRDDSINVEETLLQSSNNLEVKEVQILQIYKKYIENWKEN